MLFRYSIFLVIFVLIVVSLAQPEASAPGISAPATTARITTTTTVRGYPPTSTRRQTPPTALPPRTVTPNITKRPTRPTIRPTRLCPPQNNCTRKSPSICGRNREGMCHRFESTCELQLTNCAAVGPMHAWRRVPMMQCRNLRQNAIARCSVYMPRCPVPLPRCPRPTARGLCIMSKNRRFCRIVANRCTLRNLNCQVQPRESWTAVHLANCRGMRRGNKAMTCARRSSRGK